MTARSFLGSGYIFIGRFVDGVAQPLGDKTYADKVEITPKVDTKQSTSKGADDYGQVLESVSLSQPTEFALDLSEVTGDTLVLQFMGTTAAFTQASGSLAATAFTAHMGQQIELPHKNMTTIVVTDSAGTTTYVKDIDYTANFRMGFVQPIDGGAIDDATSIKVSGTYPAIAGTKITGQTESEVRARICFDGVNQADGSKCQVEIFEAVLSASSAFDFLADDFGKVSLTGTLKTPDGKSGPYEVVTFA